MLHNFMMAARKHGVTMEQYCESPAGSEMISPEMYMQFAMHYEKIMVEIAHQAGVAYTYIPAEIQMLFWNKCCLPVTMLLNWIKKI